MIAQLNILAYLIRLMAHPDDRLLLEKWRSKDNSENERWVVGESLSISLD
jgi:hypothetical protein